MKSITHIFFNGSEEEFKAVLTLFEEENDTGLFSEKFLLATEPRVGQQFWQLTRRGTKFLKWQGLAFRFVPSRNGLLLVHWYSAGGYPLAELEKVWLDLVSYLENLGLIDKPISPAGEQEALRPVSFDDMLASLSAAGVQERTEAYWREVVAWYIQGGRETVTQEAMAERLGVSLDAFKYQLRKRG